MAMQNMCKHATYYTDKISSSYLFVFCVRLKTFQPPLVDKQVNTFGVTLLSKIALFPVRASEVGCRLSGPEVMLKRMLIMFSDSNIWWHISIS